MVNKQPPEPRFFELPNIIVFIYIILRVKYKGARGYVLLFCLVLLAISVPFLIVSEINAADEMVSIILLLSTIVIVDIAIEELGRKDL